MAFDDDKTILLDASKRFTIFEKADDEFSTEKDKTPFGRWETVDDKGNVVPESSFLQPVDTLRPTWVNNYPYEEPPPPEPPIEYPPDIDRGVNSSFDASQMSSLFIDTIGTAPIHDTKTPMGYWTSSVLNEALEPVDEVLSAVNDSRRPTWVYNWPYTPPVPPYVPPDPSEDDLNEMRDQFNATFPLLDIDTDFSVIVRRGHVTSSSTSMNPSFVSGSARGYTLIQESSDDGWIGPNWTPNGASIYAQFVKILSNSDILSSEYFGGKWYFQLYLKDVAGRGVPTVRILLRMNSKPVGANYYPLLALDHTSSVTWMDLGFDPVAMAQGLPHVGYDAPSSSLSDTLNMRPLESGYPEHEDGLWFYIETTLPLWGVLNFTHQGWNFDESIDENRSYVSKPLAPQTPIISMWGRTRSVRINCSLVPISEVTMNRAYNVVGCMPKLGQYGGFSSGGNLERMLPFLVQSTSGYADYYLNHSLTPPSDVYRQVIANYGTRFIKRSDFSPFATNRRSMLVYTGNNSTELLYSPIARAGALGDVMLEFEDHTVITNYHANETPEEYVPFYSFDS